MDRWIGQSSSKKSIVVARRGKWPYRLAGTRYGFARAVIGYRRSRLCLRQTPASNGPKPLRFRRYPTRRPNRYE